MRWKVELCDKLSLLCLMVGKYFCLLFSICCLESLFLMQNELQSFSGYRKERYSNASKLNLL